MQKGTYQAVNISYLNRMKIGAGVKMLLTVFSTYLCLFVFTIGIWYIYDFKQ